jgi:hypothetical protein
MPSDIEPSGEGDAGCTGDREVGISSSDNAVVAAAFPAPGEPDEALPNGGRRLTENLEDTDILDARDPGRNGDCT